MSKAGKFWYSVLTILILLALSLRVDGYFKGVPFTADHILDYFLYILALLFPIHNILEVRKKIKQFKEELNVQGEYTFEELLQLKLEKEYQKKKAQTL